MDTKTLTTREREIIINELEAVIQAYEASGDNDEEYAGDYADEIRTIINKLSN